MRIAIVSHNADLTGAERSLLDVIDDLLGRGTSLYVTLPNEGPLLEELHRRRLEVAIVPYRRWGRDELGASPSDAMADALRGAQAVVEALGPFQPDVVYTNTLAVGAGALAAASLDTAHVWHVREHCDGGDGFTACLPFPDLARFADSTSNALIFNSDTVEREWSGWLTQARSERVFNYMPIRRLAPPPGSGATVPRRPGVFRLAVLGSILRKKGQMDAVRAVAALSEVGRSVDLILIGTAYDTDYLQEILELVGQEGLGDRVRHVGFHPHPEVLLAETDALLVTSRNESFGRAAIEAMQQSVPVIGGRRGGTAEIIQDGVNGLLYELGDVRQLAAQIARLQDDPALRARLGQAGLASTVRMADRDATVGRVHAVLQSLRGRHNPAGGVLPLLLAGPRPALEAVARSSWPAIPRHPRALWGNLYRALQRRVLRRGH